MQPGDPPKTTFSHQETTPPPWQRPGAGGWWLGWWLVAGLVKGHVAVKGHLAGGWCGARVEVFGFD